MENLVKTLSYFAVTVLLFTLLLGNCEQVESSADDEFSRYLRTVMSNYTGWIKRNGLDPSPSTENVIKSGRYDSRITFDCQLRNHRVRGYSDAPYESASQSNFKDQSFEMGWEIKNYLKYESDGDFNCTGLILTSSKYPELNSSLPFNGQGTFRIFRGYTNESLIMENVGITRDYKLDLSHAWPVYELHSSLDSVQLQGEWNDTRITEVKYYKDIKQRFINLYENYPFFYDHTPSFPSGQVLYRYVREIAQSVDLRQIISRDKRPNPYTPTPRPSTTKPSAGERTSVQATGLILFQAMLLIWYD